MNEADNSLIFAKLENCSVLLRSTGRYTEAPLYAKGRQIFAKVGKSYIRLYRQMEKTSLPNTHWSDLVMEDFLINDREIELTILSGPGFKKLPTKKAA